jgi:hypothetical protein
MLQNSPDLFEDHFLRFDHLPNSIEIVPADPEGLLTHVTLAAGCERHFPTIQQQQKWKRVNDSPANGNGVEM